jgi:hypothetical protein
MHQDRISDSFFEMLGLAILMFWYATVEKCGKT